LSGFIWVLIPIAAISVVCLLLLRRIDSLRATCRLTSMLFASIVLPPPGMYWAAHRWRKPGSQGPGFIGFAVGRTVFCDSLVMWRAKSFISGAGASEIGRRNRQFADVLYEAKEETR
jgi:hypothetical protein